MNNTHPTHTGLRFGGKDDAFKALLLCMLFFNYICGILPMLATNGLFEIIFTTGVLIAYRTQKLNLLGQFKQQFPLAYWLFISWLVWTFLAFFRVILFENELLSQVGMAVIRQLYLVVQIAFIFAVVKLIRLTSLTYQMLFNAMIFGLIFTLGYLLLSFHFGPEPVSENWFNYMPLLGHIRVISCVGGPVCVITLVYILLKEHPSPLFKPLMFVWLTVLWSAMFWTGGRTGISAALVSSLVVLVASAVFHRQTLIKLPIILACLIGAYFIADAMAVFSWNGLGRTLHTLQSVSSEPASIASQSTGRSFMWTVSLHAMLQHPLLGLGPGGYLFIPEKPFGTDPHNFVIQFLVEWGFVGAGLLLALMLTAVIHGFKQLPAAFREKDITYISCAGIVLVLSLYGITGSTYFHYQPLLYLLVGYSAFPYRRGFKPTA